MIQAGALIIRTSVYTLSVLLALPFGLVRAQATQQPNSSTLAEIEAEALSQLDGEASFGATANVRTASHGEPKSSLSRSVVSRRQLDERLPRSAPDALRFEPGVSIQQTAHGQASPYVRGLTGQQVVHLFDGVRLNNGIFRQGPNQYFFTIDSRTLDRLEVIRGSASTRYGSDALGGAILARPVEPWVETERGEFRLHPRVIGRFASADLEYGGRGEVGASVGLRTAAIVGGGYRRAGLLRSGGVVRGSDGNPALVPRFEDDGRTQLGTGFREATFDLRVRHELDDDLHLVAAAYGFRQFDAPRTDQCPPPEAPVSECLNIDQQFRTLTYVGLRGDAGPAMRDIELIASWQRHNEQRTRQRPRSFVELGFDNHIDTLGLSFRAATRAFDFPRSGHVTLRYGAQAYRDGVESSASQRFTDIDRTFAESRGQYIDDSSYVSLGGFSEAEFVLPYLTIRGGGRVSAVGARAAPDPESSSTSVQQEWFAAVGRIGLESQIAEPLTLYANVDQGFRAPNLDDLTSRQQVGPGFQFENANLKPERTTTYELGGRLEYEWLKIEGWAFATLLRDGIQRAVRTSDDCPPETPSCGASRTQFQLINVDGRSIILGTDGGATAYLPLGFSLRATYSYAWGEGPDTTSPAALGTSERGRVPLSRVPPLSGTVELLYRHLATGVYAAGAVRLARAQRRLAPSDLADARIPIGGTPGYATLDLRAGWRYEDWLRLSLVFENVFDAAYRVHGSSINGPGRGLIAEAEFRM